MKNNNHLKNLNEQKLKEKSLKISIKEGSAASVMGGAGDTYITPYALALNATNAQIGFLSSFVGLFGAISQIIGSRVIYKFNRKKIVLLAVFLQAAMWMIMFALGLLVWAEIIASYTAIILIVIYTICIICGSFGGPAWFSWMGDLVPEEKRGAYFSKRSRITGAISMLVTLIVAFFLDYTKVIGLVLIGFAGISLVSAIGRFISLYFLTKQYEPKYEEKKESYFSFIQFLKKAPYNNFGKFVFYVGLITLATNFAGPFFTVYMLKELHYTYTWFMIVSLAGTLFLILSLPFWGKVGDKYGNKTLLKIGGIIITFVQIPWLFSGNPIYLIFTTQLISGIGWAAFNLGASNYIYDAVTPQRRAICVAYYTMINGICVFVGAFSGGLFAQYIHINFMDTLLLIFLISSILRGITSIIFLPMIKEVRKNLKEERTLDVLKNSNSLMHHPFHFMFKSIVGKSK